MTVKWPTRRKVFAHGHACEHYPAFDDVNWRVHSVAYVDGAPVRMSANPVNLKPMTLQKDDRIDLNKITAKARVS